MDAEREIKVSRDKLNILRVGGLIKRGGLSFLDVVRLIPKDEYLQQRASHVLIHALEYHHYQPTQEEILELIKQLRMEGMIEGAYRNILRTLDELEEFPEEAEGYLFDYCMKGITNLNRPIAIRAFSIPLAFKIGRKYPELLLELKSVLLLIDPEDGVSIQVRKRDYLKKIEKILSEDSNY